MCFANPSIDVLAHEKLAMQRYASIIKGTRSPYMYPASLSHSVPASRFQIAVRKTMHKSVCRHLCSLVPASGLPRFLVK